MALYNREVQLELLQIAAQHHLRSVLLYRGWRPWVTYTHQQQQLAQMGRAHRNRHVVTRAWCGFIRCQYLTMYNVVLRELLLWH